MKIALTSLLILFMALSVICMLSAASDLFREMALSQGFQRRDSWISIVLFGKKIVPPEVLFLVSLSFFLTIATVLRARLKA